MTAFLAAAPRPPALHLPNPPATCPRRRPRPRMSLSEPARTWSTSNPPPPFDLPWPDASSSSPAGPPEYEGWSSDFLQLCDAQLQLLLSTVPATSQVLLFFRRENPSTGALEFVPLVVHSRHEDERSRRVWISKPGKPQHTELAEGSQTSPVLPGGIPAEWILPDYPFKTVGRQGGIVMPDGGLCIPVEYNGVLAGSVVLCPQDPPANMNGTQAMLWDPEDIRRADMVAKSIALGAALEGKWHASSGLLGTGKSLIDSMRMLLRTTLHQVRSPVSALVTFGHLLLRKLPPGDTNRALAKNIILEALRVDDLLQPLDDAGDAHVLPEAMDGGVPWYAKEEDQHGSSFSQELPAQNDYTAISKPPTYAKETSTKGMQLLWLSDVLVSQAEIADVLAKERQMTFHSQIDSDAPPVLAVEKYVREAVSNLIDNSLKYAPPGSHLGIYSVCADDETTNNTASQLPEDVVEVVVWDTGYGFSEGEKDAVWEFGYRGSAAERTGSPGSGIGLATVREMLHSCNAEVELISPLPSHLDPRQHLPDETLSTPGSAFCLRFKRPSR